MNYSKREIEFEKKQYQQKLFNAMGELAKNHDASVPVSKNKANKIEGGIHVDGVPYEIIDGQYTVIGPKRVIDLENVIVPKKIKKEISELLEDSSFAYIVEDLGYDIGYLAKVFSEHMEETMDLVFYYPDGSIGLCPANGKAPGFYPSERISNFPKKTTKEVIKTTLKEKVSSIFGFARVSNGKQN